MKANKLTFLSILVLLFINFFVQSCSSDENEDYIPQEIDGKLKIIEKSNQKFKSENTLHFNFYTNKNEIINFYSYQIGNKLYSSLNFKDKNKNLIEVTNFEIDLNEKNYKKNLYKIIENKSSHLKEKFSYKEIRNIENIVDILPAILFEKLARKRYYSDTSLSLFYHLSVLKSVKRSFEKDTDKCNCNIYKSSLNEKTPFFCEEDKLVSVSEAYSFIQEISSSKSFINKKFNPVNTLSYLKNKKDNLISVSKIDNILRQEFKYFWDNKLSLKEKNKIYPNYSFSNDAILTSSTIINQKLPYDPACLLYGVENGSDCGCCSNYSGPCYWCALGCYLHDQACEDCGWGCGWACVPGPC